MDNPYEPPSTLQPKPLRSSDGEELLRGVNDEVPLPIGSHKRTPAVSPMGTIMPRYIASSLDTVLAAVMCALVAKQLPDGWLIVQSLCAVVVYLGYFQFFESLLSATPGKFMMGIKVLGYDGKNCTFKQILIRTLFRLLEVNPFFLGALPAAIRIVATRDNQRFGDKFADTIVVFR